MNDNHVTILGVLCVIFESCQSPLPKKQRVVATEPKVTSAVLPTPTEPNSNRV